jgi:predicted nucleic acid-binding protein
MKKILVDSNIIIDFWKNPTVPTRSIFENEKIFICGIIQAELLHGAKSDKELQMIIEALNDLEFLDVDRSDWIEIGKYLNKLKKKGITVPFQDVIIAYLAIKNGAMLWSNDRHFVKIQSVLKKLKIFEM